MFFLHSISSFSTLLSPMLFIRIVCWPCLQCTWKNSLYWKKMSNTSVALFSQIAWKMIYSIYYMEKMHWKHPGETYCIVKLWFSRTSHPPQLGLDFRWKKNLSESKVCIHISGISSAENEIWYKTGSLVLVQFIKCIIMWIHKLTFSNAQAATYVYICYLKLLGTLNRAHK